MASGPESNAVTSPETSYPVPENEEKRLEVLHSYDILDTNVEDEFERLTDVACEFFDVPIALVSLIDDERQWFKSCVGLETRETDRSVAFCNYAITDPDPLTVPDATKDERFADNPLVTGEENIRFYAGVPLVNEEGFALGTFCVLDRQPRDADDLDLDMLERFSSEAMAQLEKRRQRKQLEEALDEKQLLLNELHHRVKNNLQVIQSLLSMQARKFEDPEVNRAFQRARDRVGSLAVVHERIQEMFEKEGGVASEKYIRELLQGIVPGGGQEDIELDIDVDNFDIDQDLIGRIGLILNELVHNSIEHGYRDGESGTIQVRLHKEGDTIQIIVTDDGRGFPDEETESGLGSTLINALVKNKLRGTVDRFNREEGGARVEIEFPAPQS
jgi:two-component sensor histidine kinase